MVVDIDYVKIETLAKIHEALDQQDLFVKDLQNWRSERVRMLSHISKHQRVEESFIRLVGFFILEIHLGATFPHIFQEG